MEVFDGPVEAVFLGGYASAAASTTAATCESERWEMTRVGQEDRGRGAEEAEFGSGG
jgi:hypothetical protein